MYCVVKGHLFILKRLSFPGQRLPFAIRKKSVLLKILFFFYLLSLLTVHVNIYQIGFYRDKVSGGMTAIFILSCY